jgi:hypothetical protein
LNSVTARPIPGTQAQKVILVAPELHDPPATTLTLGLALLAGAAGPLDDDPPPLLHPARTRTALAAVPATVAVTLRVLDNMVARLLCSPR